MTTKPLTKHMCRRALLAAAVLVASFAATTASGQGLETTEDLGLRVTQDDIITAIQEQSEFWPPVRDYVNSRQFDRVADAPTRAEAVVFLKRVHDELHDRLMGEDERRALDLVTYLGHRLRTFTIYRQLRDTVGDEAALVALVEHWDTNQRSLIALPAAERLAGSQRIVAEMRQEMIDQGLSNAVVDKAMPLWSLQGECLTLLLTTDAGKQMVKFDGEVREQRPAVARLVRRVASSAEWASIMQTDTSDPIDRDDFIKAWETLERHEVARTAAATR
ncbi:MAG: hypothetical protein R3C10_20495 [Pirellulales bacterium]|nr:hypothetical protein [Planctomycetales bacterium]